MFGLENYRNHFECLTKRQFYKLMMAWFDFLEGKFDYFENKIPLLRDKKTTLIFEIMVKDYYEYQRQLAESKQKSKAGKVGAKKRWSKKKNNTAIKKNSTAIVLEDKQISKPSVKDKVLEVLGEIK